MSESSAKSGFSWGATRELVLPATFVLCAALYYGAELPYWVVLVLAVPALVVYVLAPLWAMRSVAAFDRDAVKLLASGQAARLVPRYESALGMRLFAPPAVTAERQAMAFAESGDTRGARAAYQEALEEYGAAAPLRVMLGYAHSCFALGEDAQAIPMYRKLLATTVTLPGVERQLAHALVRSGDDASEALSLLERAVREPADRARRAELALLRAVAHARLGDREQAALLEADAGVAVSETAQSLRELLRSVLDNAALPRA